MIWPAMALRRDESRLTRVLRTLCRFLLVLIPGDSTGPCCDLVDSKDHSPPGERPGKGCRTGRPERSWAAEEWSALPRCPAETSTQTNKNKPPPARTCRASPIRSEKAWVGSRPAPVCVSTVPRSPHSVHAAAGDDGPAATTGHPPTVRNPCSPMVRESVPFPCHDRFSAGLHALRRRQPDQVKAVADHPLHPAAQGQAGAGQLPVCGQHFMLIIIAVELGGQLR